MARARVVESVDAPVVCNGSVLADSAAEAGSSSRGTYGVRTVILIFLEKTVYVRTYVRNSGKTASPVDKSVRRMVCAREPQRSCWRWAAFLSGPRGGTATQQRHVAFQ